MCDMSDDEIRLPEGIVEEDDPHGFFARFWTTPQIIFGTDPDEKVLRQMTYIRAYLYPLVIVLMKRLRVNRDKAEDLVLKFMEHLFASPAIRKNSYKKYRYYVGECVTRFAIRRLKQEAKDEKRRLPVLQYVAICYAEAQDFVVDRILNLEERQIRKAIEEGIIDDCLEVGVGNGEIFERDVAVWKLTVHGHKSRNEIAAERKDVTADGVKHALERVERYCRRHAKELRIILRNL